MYHHHHHHHQIEQDSVGQPVKVGTDQDQVSELDNPSIMSGLADLVLDNKGLLPEMEVVVRELKYGSMTVGSFMVMVASGWGRNVQIWTEFNSSRPESSRNLNLVTKERHMFIVLSRDFNVGKFLNVPKVLVGPPSNPYISKNLSMLRPTSTKFKFSL